MCYKQIRKKKEIFFLDLLQRIRYKLTMAVYKCLHGGGADILGGRLSGNLCHCWQATPAVRWHRDTVITKDKDHAGDEEFRRSSHMEQYSDQQLYVPSLSLDIWRPTCSADQQRTNYDALYKSTYHHDDYHHPKRASKSQSIVCIMCLLLLTCSTVVCL